MIRARSEVVYDPPGARKVAADAIEEAASRKNDPADLINIALERLLEGSFELPAFRTLNDMASTIRGTANDAIFATVIGRLGPAGVAASLGLLTTGPGGKSGFNRLKRTARRPSWTNFRLQLEHLRWVDGLRWSRGISGRRCWRWSGHWGLEATSADRSVLELLDYIRARLGIDLAEAS